MMINVNNHSDNKQESLLNQQDSSSRQEEIKRIRKLYIIYTLYLACVYPKTSIKLNKL